MRHSVPTELVAIDLGCVKTLRGITAPGILGSTVMRRAKKRKNLSSARRYDQIRFRFHTTKTLFRPDGLFCLDLMGFPANATLGTLLRRPRME